MSEWWKNIQFPAPPVQAAPPAVDRPPASSPAAIPGPAASRPMGGAGKMDWGQLLQMLPVLLAGNPQNRGGFLEGLQRGRLLRQNQGNQDRMFGLREQEQNQMFGLRERELEDAMSERRERQQSQSEARREQLRTLANARVDKLVQELAQVSDPDALKSLVRTWEGRLKNDFGDAYTPETLMLRLQGQPVNEPDYKPMGSAIERFLARPQFKDDDETAIAALEGSTLGKAAKALNYIVELESGERVLNRKPEELPKAPQVGSFEDYVTRKYGATPTAQQVAAARRQWEEAGRAPKEGKEAPKVSEYSKERALRTIQSVDELLPQINRWTTGYGSLLSNVPETEARSFRAQLDTLRANIAFNELTAMREASKTGGALGQVSDREGILLQSALGALDQAQSAEDIKVQLEKVKASIERWYGAVSGERLDVPKPKIADPLGIR